MCVCLQEIVQTSDCGIALSSLRASLTAALDGSSNTGSDLAAEDVVDLIVYRGFDVASMRKGSRHSLHVTGTNAAVLTECAPSGCEEMSDGSSQ